MSPNPSRTLVPRIANLAALSLLAAAMVGSAVAQGPASRPRFKVTIKDEKPVTAEVESTAPVDPVRRINYGPSGMGAMVRGANNEQLHLSHMVTFKVDDRIHNQNVGGRFEYLNRPLARGPGNKVREGFESAYILGDLRIVCTVSVVPTKPAAPGARRQRDAVLIHYLVENKGNQPHRFGVRVYMDVFVVNNDGALFAAPTLPGRILDGMILKDKQLPPYLQMLQVPNLQNPGYVAHMTFDLGRRIEKPDRIVLTRFGAAGGFNGWDMPALMAGGDSAMGAFWEPREIKPGAKREFAYAYGKGVATSPDNEGVVRLALGGSFEPGKVFDVTAYVSDPAPGQSLTLELPEGVALVEGRECQPVPAAPGEEALSLVRWRARVLRPGQFPLRVRSSTGVTQTKQVTVAANGG